MPTGRRLGSHGPDLGYGMKLARTFADRVVVTEGETLDDVGSWKGADTNVWRDHLHAATMVGRAAAACVAVELGYGIEPDSGASGRLGHWRIAGVPDEVTAVHSKRSAEITAAVVERGYDTYQARNVAARATRAHKRPRVRQPASIRRCARSWCSRRWRRTRSWHGCSPASRPSAGSSA